MGGAAERLPAHASGHRLRAVAGDDGLERVACSASDALSRPVAIVLPSLGAPVVWPVDSIPDTLLGQLVEYASAATMGAATGEPAGVARAVPIRIGQEIVGIVAAIHGNGARPQTGVADDLAWLEAAAAAAAVTRLMGDGRRDDEQDSRRDLLGMLTGSASLDVSALSGRRRARLGVDLGAGGIAVRARGRGDVLCSELPDELGDTLIAELRPGQVVGLIPLAGERSAEGDAERARRPVVGRGIRDGGVGPAEGRRRRCERRSARRWCSRSSRVRPRLRSPAQEETYRLLIGVLLRDPEELELLRSSTITPLLAYDAEHDTDLLVTLGTFLTHHGSTTETAEVMGLHRHTVGYRLARVHEVSGLSPYETDGRERLSLGLKAAQILAAQGATLKPG